MLETLNVKVDKNLTLGQLAECILFYDNVNIIVDTNNLGLLIKKIGLDTFIELGKHGLRVIVPDSTIGVFEKDRYYTIGPFSPVNIDGIHKFLTISLSKELNLSGAQLGKAIDEVLSISSINHMDETYRNILISNITDNWFEESLQLELDNANHAELIDKYHFQYHFVKGDNGLRLETNMYNPKTMKYIKENSLQSMLNPIERLLNFSSASNSLYLGATFNAEMYSSLEEEPIISCKTSELQDLAKSHFKDIETIQETFNPKYTSIEESINSGEKSMKDFIILLENSTKFKEWKKGYPNCQDFLKEFTKAAVAESKWDSTSYKIGRVSICSALGTIPVVGMILGPVLSFFDAFLLDKFVKQWNPTQFIRGDVRKFLK